MGAGPRWGRRHRRPGLVAVRAGTGALAQEVTHRAGEGLAALAGRIAARPLTSVAVAFLLGLAVGALLRRRRLAKRTSG